MRTFKFEIEDKWGRTIVLVNSKHINGAVRKLYQEYKYPFEIKKILEG